MSDAAQGTGGARADTGAEGGGQLGVLLVCFSLPWYAIAGAQAAEMAYLPILGVLAMAVIGPTAGR